MIIWCDIYALVDWRLLVPKGLHCALNGLGILGLALAGDGIRHKSLYLLSSPRRLSQNCIHAVAEGILVSRFLSI